MENKLSLKNDMVEEIIHNSFNILEEEIDFGVEEFINEFIEKNEDEDISVAKIMKKAYEIYRAGFLSAYMLRK